MPGLSSSKMWAAAPALFASVCLLAATSLSGAATLFPTPLHITRQVQDPISESTVLLNEYGYGNRLISVRGARTSIADYEKGELIEIDREAGTYSITRFDELAKAAQLINRSNPGESAPPQDARKATPTSGRRPLRTMGAKITNAGRTADFFEGDVEQQAGKHSIQVGVDRGVLVSREALEVLLGAAYPGVLRGEHEVVLTAAASGRRASGSLETTGQTDERSYGLPVEQVVRYELDGRQLEFRSSVTRVGNEPPPADLIAIPAGARLVVSRIVAVQRELEQLDHPAVIVPRTP